MPRPGLIPILLLLAAPASAGPAGPLPPEAPKTTPAAQAIALYRQEHGTPTTTPPCRQPAHGEIVVCGAADGRSAYRLPLPAERSAADGAAHATGDAAPVGVGRSPMEKMPNTGLRLTLTPGSTSLKGLGAR